eukprot:6209215-Pleurochrysis_carterae.AAC.1
MHSCAESSATTYKLATCCHFALARQIPASAFELARYIHVLVYGFSSTLELVLARMLSYHPTGLRRTGINRHDD